MRRCPAGEGALGFSGAQAAPEWVGGGNLTGIESSTASGTSVAYGYDALNRLTNVVDARLSGMARNNTGYAFDAAGSLTNALHPNDVKHHYLFNALHRLTNLTVVAAAATTLAGFAYTLDETGTRTGLSEAVAGGDRHYQWNHDLLHRLKDEVVTGTGPTGAVAYAHDVVGNRTNRSSTLAGITNQVFSYNTNDGLTMDAYDSAGNTRTNSGNVFLYDWANRLTNAVLGTTNVSIVYNGDGQRVRKSLKLGANTTTTVYLVDGRNPSGYAQVLEEKSVVGTTTNLVRAYTCGLDLISQRAPGSRTNFFGVDGLGSTRLLLTLAGGVSDTYTYDAHGSLVASTGTTTNWYLFAGEQQDAELGGWYYLRAPREYIPSLGRFNSSDSFEGHQTDPLSLHKYLYAHNNPINNTDPSGHWSLSGTLTTAGIGASIGALSTVVANHALGRAQTTSSILMGAGLGAVLGPLAAEYAWFGVAVGGVGVASSGTMVWEVFSNPNSTYVQKVEASALLVASVWGTSVGLEYARAARTQAAEQAAAAPTTKRLFRVISENELVQVRRTGEFAVTSESSNPQPGGLPGKWFYGTRQEAEAFAAAHASENPRLVATEVTQAAIKQVFPNIDGGKTGYFVHLEDLAGAEIKWLPWP